jgi:uncharacterized protein YecE (DUF72 family)
MTPFPLDQLRWRVAELAVQGIHVGTSSWKYPGWIGSVYEASNYLRYFKTSPPKHQKGRFERTCLAEYAQTFSTVCLDAGFYAFPTPQMLEGYLSQVPATFRLSIKVTEDITVLRFPNLPRFGTRAGQLNPHFLDADLFIASFLGPLEPYRGQIGTLFIEFSHFHPRDWERGREFVAHLDAFLGKLPRGWDYSVEIRNESLLHPRYFEVLKNHNVAHTFNSWTRMPPVAEQMRIVGCETADFMAARFLLRPGRSYEQAVQAFQPYREIKEPNLEAREGLMQALKPERFTGARRRYIYVNNRLEGSAPFTIAAVLGVPTSADAGITPKN